MQEGKALGLEEASSCEQTLLQAMPPGGTETFNVDGDNCVGGILNSQVSHKQIRHHILVYI